MAKSSQYEQSSPDKGEPKVEHNVVKQFVRNPTTWVAGFALGLVGWMGYDTVRYEVASHERAADIKAAARAWINGKPDALKGLSKVAISELDSTDSAPVTIARSIISADTAPAKNRAAFACALVGLNGEKLGELTREQKIVVQNGLEQNASVSDADAAYTVCSAEISGSESLLFPIGTRDAWSTTDWTDRVADSNYLTKHP